MTCQCEDLGRGRSTLQLTCYDLVAWLQVTKYHIERCHTARHGECMLCAGNLGEMILEKASCRIAGSTVVVDLALAEAFEGRRLIDGHARRVPLVIVPFRSIDSGCIVKSGVIVGRYQNKRDGVRTVSS